MNNKNIIIAGAIAIGLYLFSQTKKIRYTTTAQKVAPKRTGQPTTWAEHIAALRKATAQKIGKKIGKTVAQKVAVRKATAQKIGKKIGKTVAQKAAVRKAAAKRAWLDRNRKIKARKAAVRKATAQKIGKKIGKTVAQKVAVRKATAQKIGKKIGKTVAQKVAQKKVASWKAPYRFPNSKVRVITPSYLLKKLAKKDIARKKAVQQKKVQKTTPGTPSDKRKKRLEALYGPRWHDIWIERQKRR